MRFRTSILLHELKSSYKVISLHSGQIQTQFRRFIEEKKIWFQSQQCSSIDVFKQGYFFKSLGADDIDRTKQHMTVLFAAAGYTFDDDKWQLSVRYSKVVNPKNRNHVMKIHKIYLDCTKDLIQEMREACRLITPQSIETSEYPLLWNLMFVPQRGLSNSQQTGSSKWQMGKRNSSRTSSHTRSPDGTPM